MRISAPKVEELLARADVAEIIGRHMALKRAGRSLKGCCPFHNEKTPSFHVTPERRMWKCFGCGLGGDVIAFLMRLQARSFVDVCRDLAKELGVDLGGIEDPREKERHQLRLVNELAQRHFRARLGEVGRGELGKRYLATRRMTPETIEKFGFGFAPDSWDDLTVELKREGQLDLATRAGLVNPRQTGDGHYDVLRGRLTIPIRSPEGRILAFGARALLPDQNPKYLNSRESPLYAKSEVLYAMDLAREPIRRSGRAILVEGYFDAIGLHQAGIGQAVALCSTALTSKQLDLLTKHGAKELVMLLDGDAAGQKAIERLAAPLLAHGLPTRVAVLPDAADPDEFVLEKGAPALLKVLDEAPPLTEHLLRVALPEGAKATWEAKVVALKSVRPLVEAMAGSALERRMFLNRLAQYLGLPEAEVVGHFGPAPRSGAAPRHDGPRPAANVAPPAPAPAAPARPVLLPGVAQLRKRAAPAEELFSALLMHDGTLEKEPSFAVLDELPVGLRLLVAEKLGGGELDAAWAELEPEAARRLQRTAGEILTRWPDTENRRRAFGDAAREIRLARVEERLLEIKFEFVRRADEDLRSEELTLLFEEQQRLRDERNRLSSPLEDAAPASAPSDLARRAS